MTLSGNSRCEGTYINDKESEMSRRESKEKKIRGLCETDLTVNHLNGEVKRFMVKKFNFGN